MKKELKPTHPAAVELLITNEAGIELPVKAAIIILHSSTPLNPMNINGIFYAQNRLFYHRHTPHHNFEVVISDYCVIPELDELLYK